MKTIGLILIATFALLSSAIANAGRDGSQIREHQRAVEAKRAHDQEISQLRAVVARGQVVGQTGN
jgi:hypothetical protein